MSTPIPGYDVPAVEAWISTHVRGLTPPIELQPELQRAICARPVGPCADGAVGREGVDDGHIVQRLRRVEAVPVAGRKGLVKTLHGG